MADGEAPAAQLRAAAKLMRERATEAETPGYESDHPGKPWCPEWTYTVVRHVSRNVDTDCSAHPWDSENERDCNRWGRHAGYHIAGMHPGVALAVADWLEAEAAAADLVANDPVTARAVGLPDKRALAVARAYLGETPQPWECPHCHCLFDRAGMDHEPCRNLESAP
jgi:hypothetical protein